MKLYEDGRHYDALYLTMKPSDIRAQFWLNHAQQAAGPILELACGTGNVIIPLAQAGLDVTGLDYTEGMLTHARYKSAQLGLDITWHQGNMCNFDLGQKFKLIILTGNSLCHILHLKDLETCLSSVKKHLAPNARFIISVFTPNPNYLINKPDDRLSFGKYDDPDGGGQIIITHSYTYEHDSQIKRITTYHQYPDQAEPQVGTLDMRMYYPQELDALLHYNGLHIAHKYADYDERPFGSHPQQVEQQIIVCSE